MPTGELTSEQLIASASDAARTFIEASPGSGKTTVAAERFGFLRHCVTNDARAVVAVSFTRAATWALHNRVLARWGRSCLSPPHRVTTLDTILCDLLLFLLRTEEVLWPGGQVELRVEDDWRSLAKVEWTRRRPVAVLQGRQVRMKRTLRRKSDNHVRYDDYTRLLSQGVCTHDDVRFVIENALADPELNAIIRSRIKETVRALVVDEIFDANELDVELVKLCTEVGVETTLIGDPWQALYRFRGAVPPLVTEVVQNLGFTTHPISRSFRYQTLETQDLAKALRAGKPVSVRAGVTADADIVLAPRWQDLWSLPAWVLPLSFTRPGSVAAGAATLLLDHFLSTTLSRRAVFLNDALMCLGIAEEAVLEDMRPGFEDVIALLRQDGDELPAARAAWEQLKAAVAPHTEFAFPERNVGAHYKPLKALRRRLGSTGGRFVPGITVHQAKGCEWRRVQVALSPEHNARLANGLEREVEGDRVLFVSLTRGTHATCAVPATSARPSASDTS